MGSIQRMDALLLPELAIWTDPDLSRFCGSLLEGLSDVVRPIAVGGRRSNEVDALAQRYHLQADDDLRRMLTNHPTGYLLWASRETPAGVSLKSAWANDTHLLLLEPLATDLSEWSTLLGLNEQKIHRKLPALVYLPAFLEAPGWLSAADPTETLGQPQTLLFVSHGRPEQASLFMRMMDAWLALSHLVDLPETIHAGFFNASTPISASSHLRQAHGHIQMHARLTDGRGILVQASDLAGVSARSLTIVSENAHLTVCDQGYQWHDRQGRLQDQHVPDTASIASLDPWLTLCLAQARRHIASPRNPKTMATRDATAMALACCQAAWLSCRTGQPESPREILRLHLPLEDR